MRKTFLFLLLFTFSFTSFSQDVFDIGIRKIEIFFSEPNWEDTLDLYYANDIGQRLIADSVIIDGEVDQDVGIRYKGNSSYNVNNAKNPLNIRLDYVNNGQSIDGYNVLKLSNGFRDPSFVREVMTYEMAREYMPASKATYANVFINSIWNGLYTSSINKRGLKNVAACAIALKPKQKTAKMVSSFFILVFLWCY